MRHRYYRAIIRTLPRTNYIVLKKLVSLLAKIAENKSINKMGTVVSFFSFLLENISVLCCKFFVKNPPILAKPEGVALFLVRNMHVLPGRTP